MVINCAVSCEIGWTQFTVMKWASEAYGFISDPDPSKPFCCTTAARCPAANLTTWHAVSMPQLTVHSA